MWYRYLLNGNITDNSKDDDGKVGLVGGHGHRQTKYEAKGHPSGGALLPVVLEGVAERRHLQVSHGHEGQPGQADQQADAAPIVAGGPLPRLVVRQLVQREDQPE